MTKLNKPEVTTLIAEAAGETKNTVTRVLDALADVIASEVAAGNSLSVAGGVFSLKRSAERQGVKPGTTERITIPARVSVKFKPGRALKEAVQ